MGNLELESKIKEWANSEPKFKRFIKNKPLITQMYMKHHEAETVADCVEGGKAKLTVMIVSSITRKPIKLCKECNRKVCGDSCGAEDYVDKKARAYQAVDVNYEGSEDEDALIKVNYAPFDEHMEDLIDNKTYILEGTIGAYKKVMDIRPYKVTLVEDEGGQTDDKLLQDAISSAEDLLDMGEGSVPEAKWDKIMAEYTSVISQVMAKLNLVSKDGVITKDA